METNVERIERRIRGAGMSVSAFRRENDIPPSTWQRWKDGSERPLTRWVKIVEAVERLEAAEIAGRET